MRIGAFELSEPLPELKEPRALVTLRPWLDAGRVGREALGRLEKYCHAQEFGRLARPGNFYDFTRYRPSVKNVGAKRRVTIPNTTVLYAIREQAPDLLFFHLLEPQLFGEEYVESTLEVLKRFDVKEYTQIGGVSDLVPHSRPLLVTGLVPEEVGGRYNIEPSRYEGPTSITYLIHQEASKLGIETMTFLVRLPHYAQLDEDHAGVARLLEVLCQMYDFPPSLIDTAQGERQYQQVDAAVARNPQARALVQQLEASYDARVRETREEDPSDLAPEVKSFLREMDRRMGEQG